MDSSKVLPLVRQIYAATLDSAQWQAFVDALSEAHGGAPTGLALQLPGFPLSGVFFTSRGFQLEYRGLFVEHALRGLPWEEARRDHFVGRFGLAREVIGAAEIAASDFYRDWMEPQGLAAEGPAGHTIALEEGRPVAGVAIFPRADQGPFDEPDLELANLLVPHLGMAYRIQGEMRRHHALADAIDRFPTGVILLDARGHVLRENLAARRILDRDDGLSLIEGRLRAASPADDAALRELLASALGRSSGGAAGSHVLSVERRSEGRALPLMVSPLPSRDGEPTLADAVAVVYVADLEGGTLRRAAALRELYGLTEAESQLVELLCQGCSLEEAARVRSVTLNTARSQLKQVFAKTHTSRQSELVRLVVSGVASIDGS